MLTALNDFLWGQVLVLVLVAVGLLFTVASRGVQFRYFRRMFGVLRGGMHHERGQVSSFQALVVSVAGRVGSGNIAGVAVAITLGGPGAVFWMWLIGLMGMATSFFECSLAQLFKRTEPDGSFRGGPAYYLTHGVGQRGLAAVYSVLLLVTFGLGFNAVQSYVVATSLAESFGISTWITGLVMVVVLGSVIFGGIRRIALVSEVIVPIMALMYFLAALVVIALHITEVPAALLLIVKSAFGLEQAVGGGLGAVILQGVKRGLFSNEAGLGSAPNVAAVAHVPHPANQGVVQAFSVFIDTMIMCSCTAVIILLSDVYQPGAPDVDGVLLTQLAMGSHVGGWGATFVSVALVLFAFSSILYNYYLGDNSLSFFSHDNATVANGFRVAVLGLVFWGSLQDLSTVFGFAEITMGLLALVNLVGLVWMYRIGMRLLRDYDTQLRQGVEPRLRPDAWRDLDIDAKSWPG
ncbi:MAG: sodium:alanine symporter [Haliea sp.]|jgi:AGCS family alanine or glycine:cation symporter|uniref:alanine/glycine:cation symporter family protein n=1 Tax=Haliea sp. TaxID=1932666 RepID=UPI000C48A916|nr:alanine/glycine:cation symporter family protein [Haliea sp.]MBM69289.1 sodium:alanine symporter [Haliea sp.]|tara:strand:+ start:40227 stop:41615 length:1389 start_codon:yes stop_codon:yes gene_type:complete